MARDNKRKNRGETDMVEARVLTQRDVDRANRTASVTSYDGSAAVESANKTMGLRRKNDSTDVREVAPARDPGGGAGRIRPSRPTLSRPELEEQMRRARHDASSERMRRRRAVGGISARGPTRSQQAILAGGPTAADFLESRVNAITAASQPNAAESEAKKLGLRRLESDRQFASDTRDQNTVLRGQDMTDRISLRETETDRDISRNELFAEYNDRNRPAIPTTTDEDGNEVIDYTGAGNMSADDQKRFVEAVGGSVSAAAQQSGLEIDADQAGQRAFNMFQQTDPNSPSLPRNRAQLERAATVAQILPTLGEDIPVATSFDQLNNQLLQIAGSEEDNLFSGRTAEIGGETVNLDDATGPGREYLIQLRGAAKDAALAAAEDNPEVARRALTNIVESELKDARNQVRETFAENQTASSRNSPSAISQRSLRRSGEVEADPQVQRLQQSLKALREGDLTGFRSAYELNLEDESEEAGRITNQR